jgi:hypothetical protein
LEQFRIFLHCCPSPEERDTNSDTAVLALELSEPPAIAQATKSDHTWNLAVEKVRCLLSAASKLRHTIEKSEIVPASLYGLTTRSDRLMSHAQYELLVNGYRQVEQFVRDIGTLKAVLEGPGTVECEMMSILTWLQQRMQEESAQFCVFTSSLQASAGATEQKATVKAFREDTERLLKSILLAIQDVYKHCNERSDECMEEDDTKQSEEVENSGNEGNKIENGHVKALESLSASLSMFRMTELNDGLRRLTQRLVTILDADGVQEGNICKRLVSFP